MSIILIPAPQTKRSPAGTQADPTTLRQVISFRLSPEARAHVRALSEETGVPMSRLVDKLILSAESSDFSIESK